MDARQRFTLVAITMMLLVGCSGSETESTNGARTDANGGLDSAMSSFSSDANSISLDIAAKEFQKQLDSQESQLSAAKASAKTFDDKPLNKLISDMEDKIAEARSMLGKLAKADSDSAATLQEELAGLMKELPALYDEIKTKIKVLGG